MNEEKSSATAWLAKAASDLEASKRLISGDNPLLDSGVFHAQQAGEKALKGFLTNGRKPFPKSHDLGILLDLALQLDPTLESLQEHCFVLTPYAIEFRYPGNIFEPSNEDAKAALRLAKEMVIRIQEKIEE